MARMRLRNNEPPPPPHTHTVTQPRALSPGPCILEGSWVLMSGVRKYPKQGYRHSYPTYHAFLEVHVSGVLSTLNKVLAIVTLLTSLVTSTP